MRTKGEILMRRINWGLFGTLIACIGFYVLHAVCLQRAGIGIPDPNYFLLFLGGFGLWSLFVSAGVFLQARSTFLRDFILFLFPVAGAFSGAIIAFYGMGLGGIELWTEHLRVQQVFEVSLAIYAAAAVGQTIIWIILPKQVVPEDSFLILDGVFLRPGEKYSLCPFLRYAKIKINETMPVTLSKLQLACRDGKFRASCEVSVSLGVREVRSLFFNYDKLDFPTLLVRDVKDYMSRVVVENAPWRSLGEIIQEGKRGFGLDKNIGCVEVCGLKIPLYWSGKATYSEIEVA